MSSDIAKTMPTSTRRQAHSRFRNRHSAEQTVEVPGDVVPTPTVDLNAATVEIMEHEDQLIDEDESDEGTSSLTQSMIYAHSTTQTLLKSKNFHLQASRRSHLLHRGL